MDIQKLIQEISQVMDEAIEQFNSGIAQSQTDLYAKLETLLKNELETKGDIIRPSNRNFKLLGQLQNEIINTILNKQYIDSLKKYLAVHDVVAGLIDKYFSIMVKEFSPKANEALKKSLMETTINSLTEAGIGINIADPIRDVLSTNITTGGYYASLTKQLRETLLAGPDSEGLLQRYTKQIATDAIQQFNAEYTQALSADLGLEWFQYIGSNIVTTRDFCTHLTKKRWVHISEIPGILSGVIDGVEIPLNKQGLPYGMIKGTNVSNFKVYRGGYNCRHQFYPVTEALVPQDVKSELYASAVYKAWKGAA